VEQSVPGGQAKETSTAVSRKALAFLPGQEVSMKLTDVRLLVEDVPRSVAFYRDVVGLPVGLETAEEVYAEIKAGDATLGLYRRDLMQSVLGENASIGAPGSAVLILAVDDVDAEYERLTATGAQAVTKPHDQEAWGLRVCHFRDPDGHVIELNHPID
jgi:lactoylglutathione lyase